MPGRFFPRQHGNDNGTDNDIKYRGYRHSQYDDGGRCLSILQNRIITHHQGQQKADIADKTYAAEK